MIDTGRFTVHVEPTNLVALVAGEARLLSGRDPRVIVEERLPATEVTVRTDPTRVQTILANLLSNALKYGGDPPQVSITVEAAGVDGGALVRVRDNGAGIDEADAALIFDRYYRSNDAQQSDRRGLGLGLYLSKQIADRLGASLRFTTERGVGTEFVLQLPAEAPVPASEPS